MTFDVILKITATHFQDYEIYSLPLFFPCSLRCGVIWETIPELLKSTPECAGEFQWHQEGFMPSADKISFSYLSRHFPTSALLITLTFILCFNCFICFFESCKTKAFVEDFFLLLIVRAKKCSCSQWLNFTFIFDAQEPSSGWILWDYLA